MSPAPQPLPRGEQARQEAILFETTVAMLGALVRLTAVKGLDLDRARSVVRLAARAAERRL